MAKMEVARPCPMARAPTSQATARVGPTVLPVVNACRVVAFVVSGQNGMLRRRILSSDNPSKLATWVLPSTVFPCLGFGPAGMIVCRGSLACGGSHLPPTGSGDLTVTSCMTPKVRFLAGVVCVLLSRGALILQVACRAP